MYWHRLTKQDFPPPGDVLLWVNCRDGGFPVLAYAEKVGHIIWWWNSSGQSFLDKSQWRNTRWAELEPPEGVVEQMRGTVEIVRCKDCKHWVPGYITDEDDFIPPRCLDNHGVGWSANDFCSYWVKK